MFHSVVYEINERTRHLDDDNIEIIAYLLGQYIDMYRARTYRGGIRHNNVGIFTSDKHLSQ